MAYSKPNVQSFTASGTWTKPLNPDYTVVEVWCIGGGQGGSAGRRGAAGTVRCGGGGGASLNGNTSGKGGDGGPGFIQVITR